MAYIKNVASISLGNDGTYILTIDADCYIEEEENDEEMSYSSDNDDLVFTAKDIEELKSLLEKYLTKVKYKTAEDVFNKIKM